MWVTFICSNCYIRFFKMHFECLVKRYCSQTFSPTLQTGFNIPVYNIFFQMTIQNSFCTRGSEHERIYFEDRLIIAKKNVRICGKMSNTNSKNTSIWKAFEEFHSRFVSYPEHRIQCATLVQIFHILSSEFKWWHLLYRLIFFMVILMFSK